MWPDLTSELCAVSYLIYQSTSAVPYSIVPYFDLVKKEYTFLVGRSILDHQILEKFDN